MMDSSPLDTSLPAVREYVALVRLQVLTPLSLLLALASFLVCAFVLRPSLADLVHLYPSVLAPNKRVVGVYLALLFVAQIGLCVLLVVARDPHTKHLLRATAPPLIAANILAALWAPAFALQSFVPAAALQGTLLVALVFALGAGWVSGPGSWPARLFVHAPIRAFFFAPLYIGFPYCLLYVYKRHLPSRVALTRPCIYLSAALCLMPTLRLSCQPQCPTLAHDWSIHVRSDVDLTCILRSQLMTRARTYLARVHPILSVALGWTWSPGEPQHFRNHAYAGAAVVLGVNILALVVIVWRHDLVGCVCASWLCAALWSVDPKAAEVWIPAAVFTALRPLALLAAWLWRRIRPRRRQPIALPPDDAEAARAQQHARAPAPEGERPAREVDVDALWG